MFSARLYRIVRNPYSGFTVQVKRWWFPWWADIFSEHTHEEARKRAAGHAAGVVEYLGHWAKETKTLPEGIVDFMPIDADGFGIAVMRTAEHYVRDTPLPVRQEHARRMGWEVPSE